MTWDGWNDANTEEAVRRWQVGESCGVIALAIGAPSRNSVIGRLHRLGYSHKSRLATTHVTMEYPKHRNFKPKAAKMKPQPAPPPATRVFTGPGKQCRYIYGDPRKDFYFCPNRALPGQSYCPDCRDRCYVPVQPRRVRAR